MKMRGTKSQFTKRTQPYVHVVTMTTTEEGITLLRRTKAFLDRGRFHEGDSAKNALHYHGEVC